MKITKPEQRGKTPNEKHSDTIGRARLEKGREGRVKYEKELMRVKDGCERKQRKVERVEVRV